MKSNYLLLSALLLSMSSYAQQITVNFEEYEPKSTLVVPEHIPQKPNFLLLMFIIISGIYMKKKKIWTN
jgi:hypothetical protein